MTDWQPIETAPKDGTRVLVFKPGGAERNVIAYWQHARSSRTPGLWRTLPGLYPCEPTHWQPLGEAPASSADGPEGHGTAEPNSGPTP